MFWIKHMGLGKRPLMSDNNPNVWANWIRVSNPRNPNFRLMTGLLVERIKNYIGPGTEVVQAVNTDAYLAGPIERYLNGGGRAVEVSEEIIGECFAQATRVTPVYMTSKTRANEKTFIVKIPAAGTKVPRQLRMSSRLIPTRLLAEKPRATAVQTLRLERARKQQTP
ncbi:Vegetative incompatibility protein HET-E-1 [Ceratocystis lukuohia]|uniref:Vegetative incompatibility protein HET-E-1 n=1 Tax=Ceratocystis lukuohia TaxID=2019550 RepID=A0ABR4MDZ4_9PEZI